MAQGLLYVIWTQQDRFIFFFNGRKMQADSDRKTRVPTVLVISGSNIAESPKDLFALIQNQGYRCVTQSSIEDLLDCTESADYLALIIDIDSVEVTNRSIRDLKRKYPGIELLCISGTRFHPDLKEAIAHHFYACLMKPVDPEELFYWLKCISENEKGARVSP